MNLRNLSFITLLQALAPMIQGATDPAGEYIYPVTETAEEIRLDGILTEQAWKSLPVAGAFWMSYPMDDRRVEDQMRTEVRVTANEQFLYIGAVCYGPDHYVIKTLKRDAEFWDGDAFGVVIDPVNEKTNGFTFGVTPAGVQTEYLVTGHAGRKQEPEPGQVPRGINVAWDNRWLAEVSTYPDRWEVEIAIPFKTLRFDEGKTQWGINFFRRDARTHSIQTWAPVPMEFNETDLGYTGTLAWKRPPGKARGNLAIIPYIRAGVSRDFETGTSIEPDVQPGLDAKVPVTASLNLDLTVNPDFSQVEVDEQVINLTLFNIRLPEKRLFFLENSDVFEDFGIPPMRPFFSRKIGLDEEGYPIPILYGARLSGNVNKDLRIGVMNLQTRETELVLPQNYTVAALHQKVLRRSVVRGYFLNRDALKNEQPDYNRDAGLEFQYMSPDGRFRTFGGLSKSFSPGMKGRDYFYNSGISYDNRNLSIYSNLAGLGKNYRADMGYIMGQEYYDAVRDTSILVGYNHWFTRGSYTFYPEKSARIISHVVSGRYTYDGDSTFSMLLNQTEIGYSVMFTSTAQVRVSYRLEDVNLLYPFDFIEGRPLQTGIYHNNQAELVLQSDQRRLFSMTGGFLYGSFYGGTRARYTLGVRYRAQPWGNFSMHFEQNDLKFPGPVGEERLFLVGPRIEINFSRNLFWTTFIQYNTQEDNFNVNSRFQWRFQPMSDLYIVYTDNYAVEHWGPKQRALVVKLNYWFNL